MRNRKDKLPLELNLREEGKVRQESNLPLGNPKFAVKRKSRVLQ